MKTVQTFCFDQLADRIKSDEKYVLLDDHQDAMRELVLNNFKVNSDALRNSKDDNIKLGLTVLKMRCALSEIRPITEGAINYFENDKAFDYEKLDKIIELIDEALK